MVYLIMLMWYVSNCMQLIPNKYGSLWIMGHMLAVGIFALVILVIYPWFSMPTVLRHSSARAWVDSRRWWLSTSRSQRLWKHWQGSELCQKSGFLRCCFGWSFGLHWLPPDAQKPYEAWIWSRSTVSLRGKAVSAEELGLHSNRTSF